MHAKKAELARAEHGFEPPDEAVFGLIKVGSSGEAFHHQITCEWIVHHFGLALAAHQTPVDRNRVRCAAGINQGIDAAITHMDIQEFIGVYDQYPIGAANEVGFTSARIGGALWGQAGCRNV
ncbi:hypothetical protein OAD19_04905 [Octadecabacter sp.]|nr:hypothetical protein [Octadecabacter sp.]